MDVSLQFVGAKLYNISCCQTDHKKFLNKYIHRVIFTVNKTEILGVKNYIFLHILWANTFAQTEILAKSDHFLASLMFRVPSLSMLFNSTELLRAAGCWLLVLQKDPSEGS